MGFLGFDVLFGFGEGEGVGERHDGGGMVGFARALTWWVSESRQGIRLENRISNADQDDSGGAVSGKADLYGRYGNKGFLKDHKGSHAMKCDCSNLELTMWLFNYPCANKK